jgi:hypothetical protein
MSQRRLVSLSHKTNPLAKRLAQTFSKQFLSQLLRTAAPTLVALSFAGISSVAHAQGTMDFSGAQTLMGTFKKLMRHADIAMTTKYGRSSMLNVTRPANARIVEMVMREEAKKQKTEPAA